MCVIASDDLSSPIALFHHLCWQFAASIIHWVESGNVRCMFCRRILLSCCALSRQRCSLERWWVSMITLDAWRQERERSSTSPHPSECFDCFPNHISERQLLHVIVNSNPVHHPPLLYNRAPPCVILTTSILVSLLLCPSIYLSLVPFCYIHPYSVHLSILSCSFSFAPISRCPFSFHPVTNEFGSHLSC